MSTIAAKIKKALAIDKSITFYKSGEFRQFGLLRLQGTGSYFCNPGDQYQKGEVKHELLST